MKKQVLFVATLLFATQLTTAQVLYSENFDNLTLGNVGTDFTGNTPGQGGWYTKSNTATANQSNNYFKIIAETGMGKVLEITSPVVNNTTSARVNTAIIKDLEKNWNNRTVGNDVLKIEYDFYTNESSTNINSDNGHMILAIKQYALFYLYYGGATGSARVSSVTTGGLGTMLSPTILPKKIWLKFVYYVDFTNQKIYFRIPALAINEVKTTTVDMSNDLVTALHLTSMTGTAPYDQSVYKYDNIIVSAVSTIPSASVDNVLSSKFNIYPNPVTNMLTVTNGENIIIKKLTVYDVNGKTIKEQKGIDEKEITLNVENLSAGTYLLHIKTNSGIAVKSFIKK